MFKCCAGGALEFTIDKRLGMMYIGVGSKSGTANGSDPLTAPNGLTGVSGRTADRMITHPLISVTYRTGVSGFLFTATGSPLLYRGCMMVMSALHCARLISSTLVRSVIPLSQAVGELRAVVKDDDAGKHIDDLLASWSRVCWGIVEPSDCYKPDRPDLSPRQKWALARAKRVGSIRVQDMKDKYGGAYSSEAYRLDLRRLVQGGELLAVGRTKARYYVPVDGDGDGDDDGHQVNTPDKSTGVSGAHVQAVSGGPANRRHSSTVWNDGRGGAR